MATSKLIDMPELLSNSETPTDAPGTPNSATTSLSTLSTTAIKDGHRGNALQHVSYGNQHRPSSNTLEAERADRISRLAGLERVSTVRFNQNQTQVGMGTGPGSIVFGGSVSHYFDQYGNPSQVARKSTVGSASATGSMGERGTTWASGSVREDEDYISVDTTDDRDRLSTSALDEELDRDGDGMSDNQSLVGFGEGAGSTGSGPTYFRSRCILSQNQSGPGTPITTDTEKQRREVRMIDGLASESSGNGFTETIRRSEGREQAERILREKIGGATSGRHIGSIEEGSSVLGKIHFEERK